MARLRDGVEQLASSALIDPLWATGAAIIVLYQPPLFDVLPMYCLFLFFTPFYICWIQRGRTWPLLAFSFVLWLAAQTHGMANLLRGFPPDWGIHDFVFDPLAWQILFIGGCTIGSLWIKYDCKWRPGNGLLWLALAAVGLGLYVRYLPTTEDWKILLGHASYRGTLAPARLLSTAAILTCVGFWALRFPAWFTLDLLARLGRNSLYIFLYQIALIYIIDYWCDQVLTLPLGNWLDLIVVVLCTASLWIPARICDQIKSARRERRRSQN
jgi:hypothetical protein